MKTIKDIIELYKPKSADEDRFVKKHVIKKTEDANGNKDDVFNATNVKSVDRTPKHGYNPGEDEQVYEDYQEIRFDDPENNSKSSDSTRDSRSRSERIRDTMNKLGNQYGRKNLASDIEKKYKKKKTFADKTMDYASGKRYTDPKNEEFVSEDTHSDHFKFLLPLQKAGVPAPSKERAMDLIAKHGDPLRAGKAYVDRYKKIKNVANKVQKEETELDEARKSRKMSPQEKMDRLLKRYGLPQTKHFPKDGTDTGTTSSLEGKAKQGKIEDVAKRTMQNNSYESENELVLNPFLRGLLEATCKECSKTYKKGGSCSCCMKEDVQLDEILTPSMGAGAYIDDFVNSKDPKFAGKSKEKRRQMALAAYYAAKRGK